MDDAGAAAAQEARGERVGVRLPGGAKPEDADATRAPGVLTSGASSGGRGGASARAGEAWPCCWAGEVAGASPGLATGGGEGGEEDGAPSSPAISCSRRYARFCRAGCSVVADRPSARPAAGEPDAPSMPPAGRLGNDDDDDREPPLLRYKDRMSMGGTAGAACTYAAAASCPATDAPRRLRSPPGFAASTDCAPE